MFFLLYTLYFLHNTQITAWRIQLKPLLIKYRHLVAKSNLFKIISSLYVSLLSDLYVSTKILFV